MRFSVRTLDGIVVVTVAGAVDSRAAGDLYDILVERSGESGTRLIVDLSGVDVVTRAGVRGLVVAAELLRPGRGDMRICGARRSIEAFLHSLGFNHLLRFDPTLHMSIAQLRGGENRNAGAQAMVVPIGAPYPARTPEPYPSGAGNAVEEAVIRRRGAL